MGKVLSKCCKGRKKKYKQNGQKEHAQPQQDESDVRVATNQGATVDKPSVREDEGGNKPSDKKSEQNDQEDNKTKQKHKRHSGKRIVSTSDGTTSSSDSSSDSSSSDSDVDRTKSSKKVYRNKSGGTTIISKKTIIGGTQTNIGKNAGNVTINIGTGAGRKPKVKTDKHNKSAKRGIFNSYYSASEAKEEEAQQYAAPWGPGPGYTRPLGNFIDTRNAPLVRPVFEASVEVEVAKWVCQICCSNGTETLTGTGFRVGSRYIMTANHVVKHIVDTAYRPIGSPEDQNPYAALKSPNVYARFNYLTNTQPSERDKFRFKPVVHFRDDEVDTAVLELEDPHVGMGPIPLSFTYFSLPRTDTEFVFIGHSQNNRKAFNDVKKVINLNCAETQADIRTVKERSLQHCGREYEFPDHNVLKNRHRYLLHCKFTKGASGSPGVVILEDGRVVVVTMLLCGYPNWFYDPSVDEHFKHTWPKEFCVEQGVNITSVYEKMMIQNPNLCRDIFGIHTDSLPNPDLHVLHGYNSDFTQ